MVEDDLEVVVLGGGLFELEDELLVVVFFVGLFFAGLFLVGLFLEELVVFFDLLEEVSELFFLLLFETIDCERGSAEVPSVTSILCTSVIVVISLLNTS